MKTIPGGMAVEEFLQHYWQQKPLLIRQAFPEITTPFSPEELAGLACEIDSARIIQEHSIPHWQFQSSPFTDEDFLSLPETHWTLLINDLEQYFPELHTLIDHFNFIPDWRVDDLMVSYAPDQGSVGPHVDEYDVFLIQAHGKRQWQIDSKANLTDIIPDIDLCLLNNFNAEESWVLSAGDMLYLPPNLAHHGIAQGDCMTFSVGFRAPSQRDLLESYIGYLSEQTSTQKRFSDHGRKPQEHSAEITPHDISALKELLLESLQQDDHVITDWLGRYLTESKNLNILTADTEQTYQPNTPYQRTPATRMTWFRKQDSIHFFYSGASTTYPIIYLEAIEYLTENKAYNEQQLQKRMSDASFAQLFNKLLQSGCIEEAE